MPNGIIMTSMEGTVQTGNPPIDLNTMSMFVGQQQPPNITMGMTYFNNQNYASRSSAYQNMENVDSSDGMPRSI
jgi:hypothetical protein